MMSPRLRSAVVLLVAVAAFPACRSTTVISARHAPLYRAISHTSTISATATNEERGLRQIVLTVTTGEMTDCTELGVPASVIPCRRSASTITHTCAFPDEPETATCEYVQPLGDAALVSYRAQAVPVRGSARSTPEVTYAAGIPPTAWIARPMWWHRGESFDGQIDLGFFPDFDYDGFYSRFTDDAEAIVDGAFFNDQPFADLYSRNLRRFNLWAAPFGTDAERCSRTYSASVAPIRAAMDGGAIIHSVAFRDCAAIAEGGSGSVDATVSDSDWLLVHESGHFLHGQGDEYCCDGGYGTAGTCQNVFASEAACETYASDNGLDADDCQEIMNASTDTGRWRLDDGGTETMRSRSDNSDWRTTSRQCVQRRFSNCLSGTCY